MLVCSGKGNFWEGNKLHLYEYGLPGAINDFGGLFANIDKYYLRQLKITNERSKNFMGR
jgi:hypothetical protein